MLTGAMDTVDAVVNIVRLIVSMRERSPARDAGRIICGTSSLDARAWLISQNAVHRCPPSIGSDRNGIRPTFGASFIRITLSQHSIN